jgi:hypothetical protein
MERPRRDEAFEHAVVQRRPFTWRGVLYCLGIAVVGLVLAVAATGKPHSIGIGLIALGVLSALSGTLHLGWARLRHKETSPE